MTSFASLWNSEACTLIKFCVEDVNFVVSILSKVVIVDLVVYFGLL